MSTKPDTSGLTSDPEIGCPPDLEAWYDDHGWPEHVVFDGRPQPEGYDADDGEF